MILSKLSSQTDTSIIIINNGSFEGTPQCCVVPVGWQDCGFRGETPPDIQPAIDDNSRPLFGVTKSSFHGNTYLGLVVRSNDTYERVAQRLNKPMLKGRCYSFSIYLCRSDTYLSATNADPNNKQQYTTPLKLRIWGGEAYCNQKELMAESVLIENTEWQLYEFEFKPKSNLTYLELEAFYKTPVLFPYNGNLLLDNASHLKLIPCPENKVAYKEYHKQKNKEKTILADKKPIVKNQSGTTVQNFPTKRDRILKDLESKKVKVGQTIRIEKLFFAADSSNIKPESYVVLDELYDFLNQNKNIKIEVGGHTNNIPAHTYCDRLSMNRAKAVKEYLTFKGIDNERITYRGYGKRNPIATNSSREGRLLNQRVEIKILSIAG